MFKISGWQKIIILAILIRLLIMPFYYHPDIKTYHFQSSFLKQGIVDIYSYLKTNKDSLTLKEEFVYFPLTYFFLGGYQILAGSFLGSDFNTWLADASQTATQNINIFRYLFILKFPYLVLDLGIGFLLCALFRNEQQRKKILTFWLFNPLSIILIYTFSNIDVIVVFLTLFSLLLAQRGRMVVAALSLGIGAGFKAYPLLLVPFLFLSGKNVKERVGILLASFVPFLLIIGPFLKVPSFKETTFTSGLMARLTLAGINLGFNETLIVGVLLLAILFFRGISGSFIDQENLWKHYLAVFLVVFSVIHFHIQWILWILPFCLIAILNLPRLTALLISLLMIALAIPLLYDDKAMTFGLLSTISPLYNLLPTPFVILQKVYEPYVIQSILHSVLAGGSIVAIWQIFREREV